MTITPTQRKVARMAVGLAPEDVIVAQAENTAELRGDPDYVARWLDHERTMDHLDAVAYIGAIVTLDLV